MPNCCVLGCGNRSDRKSDKRITYHRFPNNPGRLNRWLKAIHRETWKPSKYAVICSDHFPESCFDRTGNETKLFLHAVPSIYCNKLSKNNVKKESTTVAAVGNSISVSNFPEFKITDVRTVNDTQGLDFKDPPQERLEFSTVVEEVDDTDIDIADEQELPQESVINKPPMVTPVPASNVKSNNSTTTFIHNVVPKNQSVPGPVLIPVNILNTISSPAPTSSKAPINSNLCYIIPKISVGSPGISNNSVTNKNQMQANVTSSSSTTNLIPPSVPAPQMSSSNADVMIVVENSANEHPVERDGNSASVPATSKSNVTTKSILKKIEGRHILVPRYFGDVCPEDLECPERAKMCWKLAETEVGKLKSKVKILHQKNNRLTQKVKCLKTLFHYLEETNFLNEYAKSAIKAVLPDKSEEASS